jgi:ABC-type multidrug transport system fused ATPase/permease subunit
MPVRLREGLAVLALGIRTEPWVFALAMVASVGFAAGTVWSAQVVGQVTAEVIEPAFRTGQVNRQALAVGAGLLVAVALLRAVSIAGRRFLAGVMQFRLQARDRRAVTRQYLRLPLRWHQRHPTGALLSNANADVEARWAPIAPLPMAVGTLMLLVLAAASMLRVDVVLGAVALAVLPMVVAVNVVYQRRLGPIAGRAQALRAEVSAFAYESFDGALVVKALGREDAETQRFARSTHALRDANVQVGRVRGLFDPVVEALPTLAVLGVLVAGTGRVAAGLVSAAEVVQVAYLFTIMSFPIRAIGWLLGEMPRSVVGSRRVQAVLDADESMPHGELRLAGRDPLLVEATGVDFGYEPGTPTLVDVALSLPRGRLVALVGATGSGKSTLVALLARLLDPDQGEVRHDGIPVTGLAHGEVPAATAVVPQQAFLFDDTVRDNVTLGRDVPDEQVWAALRRAHVADVVAALPAGLDTMVGERGATLSGGQRQRLALARALVRRPRFLLLDDATSAVDPDVERRIFDALRSSEHTTADAPTTLVVTHRPATMAGADEVLLLDGRTVAGRGRHADLLASSPRYAQIVRAYETVDDEAEVLVRGAL